MYRSVFFLFVFLNIISINAQSDKDITAAGINFYLNSIKGQRLNHDQKTGLSILQNLLTNQSNREHELNLARESRTEIDLGGNRQDIQILPGPSGDLYLVLENKVYPISSNTINDVRNYSSSSPNTEIKISESNEFKAIEYSIEARKHWQAKDYDLAILTAQKSLDLDPDNNSAIFIMGAAWLFSDYDYNIAIEYLEKSIKEYPQKGIIHNYLGMAYSKIGNYSKAVQYFTNSNIYSTDNKLIEYNYFLRGKAFYKNGNFQEAIRDFTEVINMNPQMSMAYKSRADCYSKLGKNDLSKHDYESYKNLISSKSN